MTSSGKKIVVPPPFSFSVEEIEKCISDMKYIQQFQANLKADLGTKQLRHDTLIENGWRTVKNFMGWGNESKEKTYDFISKTCENADKIMRERFPSKERIDHRRAYAVYINLVEIDRGIEQIMKTYDYHAGIVGSFRAVIESNKIRRKDIYETYSHIIDREGDPPQDEVGVLNEEKTLTTQNGETF